MSTQGPVGDASSSGSRYATVAHVMVPGGEENSTVQYIVYKQKTLPGMLSLSESVRSQAPFFQMDQPGAAAWVTANTTLTSTTWRETEELII